MSITRTISLLAVHAPAAAGLALFRRDALPRFTARLLARLGPVYIKLGQVLSTRQDLLSPSYLEHFAALRDQVPEDDARAMRATLAEAFPEGLEQVFCYFKPEPIATGSVAQVYRARLNGSDDWVAVKVLRPGVRKAIEDNFKLIRLLARAACWLSSNLRSTNLIGMLDELYELLLQQTDLRTEALNLQEFGQSYAGHRHILVPRLYADHSGANVLVTEYVSGIAPYEYKRLEYSRQQLAKWVDAVLDDMVFIKGLCHADLHPGNFFWNQAGQMILIDFGLVHRISQLDRNHIMAFYFAIVEGHYEFAADYFVRHFINGRCSDLAAIQEVKALIHQYYVQSGGQPRFGEIFSHILDWLGCNRLQLTSGYSKIFLTLVTVEGYLYALDPDFDMMENARRKRLDMAEYASVPEQAERLVLEDFATYSCGYFENTEDARQAYEDRDELTLGMLGVGLGTRLIDVGCGRGNLLRSATERGAHGLGITISRIEHEACGQRGLNSLWSSWEQCMLEPDHPFSQVDAISAIELLFHIGSLHENRHGLVDCRLPRFFDWACGLLRPGGKLFLQELIIEPSFLHDAAYAEQYQRLTAELPWIGFNTLEQIERHAAPCFHLLRVMPHHQDLLHTFSFQKRQIERHRAALCELVDADLFAYLESQIDWLLELARQGSLKLYRILLEKPL